MTESAPGPGSPEKQSSTQKESPDQAPQEPGSPPQQESPAQSQSSGGPPSDAGEFFTVAQVGDIQEGRGCAFNVGGRTIALFLHGGQYYALDDFCPHMGASLAIGSIYKDAVTCPLHAWRFQLTDGAWLDNPRVKVETFQVRLQGDQIQVCVPPRTDVKLPGGRR